MPAILPSVSRPRSPISRPSCPSESATRASRSRSSRASRRPWRRRWKPPATARTAGTAASRIVSQRRAIPLWLCSRMRRWLSSPCVASKRDRYSSRCSGSCRARAFWSAHRALQGGDDLRLHAQAEPGPGDLAVEQPEHRGGGEQHPGEGHEGGADVHFFFPVRNRQPPRVFEQGGPADRGGHQQIDHLAERLGLILDGFGDRPGAAGLLGRERLGEPALGFELLGLGEGDHPQRHLDAGEAGGGGARISTSRASRHHSARRSKEGRVTRAARPEASMRVTM